MVITPDEYQQILEIFYQLLLEHEDPQIRANAAIYLGKLGDGAAISTLEKAVFQDRDIQVRCKIMEALALIAKPELMMPDQPKVQMNFNAPVTGVAGNVEGDMVIDVANPQETDATRQITQFLDKLRQKYPTSTDDQIFEILIQDFGSMPQQDPQNWQRWQDILSVIFAGGIEATKILHPIAGIPIEVTKRLYDIYQRNRKQLPDS